MSEACAQLEYTEHYPDEEPQLRPEAAIVVFRIVQEGLSHIIVAVRPHRVQLSVQQAADALRLSLLAHVKLGGAASQAGPPAASDPLEREMIRQRVLRLGGDYQWRDGGAPGNDEGQSSCELNVSLPLASLRA
jgi:signal transduction histidine kinase